MGDCIDCTMCVQACPTGIDIRDGLQYECIACGACIDACDQIMDKMGYPRGLIRYTTENSLQGQSVKLLRPRVLVYATLLLVLSGLFITGIAMRTPLRLDIIPDRNQLYRIVDTDTVENVYMLKIMNMSQNEQRYRINVGGLPDLAIRTRPGTVTVAPGEVRNVPATVRADAAGLGGGGHDITVTVTGLDAPGHEVTSMTRFHAPVPE